MEECILCDRQWNLSDYVLFRQYSDLLRGELAKWGFKRESASSQFLSVYIYGGLIANVTRRIQGCEKPFKWVSLCQLYILFLAKQTSVTDINKTYNSHVLVF